MKSALSIVVPVFVVYLWLAAGSGHIGGLWSAAELGLGVALSLITGAISAAHLRGSRVRLTLNPLKWLLALVYFVGPFFWEMALANFDVAYRVITGRINPGIIRVKSGMRSDLATMQLANSITLTPGTLTVGVDEATNDLFIHKINLKPGDESRDWQARDLFTFDLPGWLRRMSDA